ncbi:MAG TPA: NADPH-dependent FMN reductase [Kofleriaceae bacterium]|nr:NADPH-dependent FMN reductase [Kofleriaceae bacterium]
MTTILAVAGSVRARSFNAMLLRAAAGFVPAGTTVESASIKDIPLYDGDAEAASGVPAVVEALKDRIAAASGLLLVTPEYNNSLPGVFKNAIDWTSRPPADIARVYRGKPVGVIGATPGPGGTGLAQAAWLPVLRTLGTVPFFGARVQVPQAGKVFDDHGTLIDPTVRGQLEKYMAGFAEFVTRLTR